MAPQISYLASRVRDNVISKLGHGFDPRCTLYICQPFSIPSQIQIVYYGGTKRLRAVSKPPEQPERCSEQNWRPPPSAWLPQCHSLVEEVSKDVDRYFIQNWKFPNTKSEMKFLKAGFSRVTCYYFPLARNDRIHFACRLLTVLFLIDDVLEDLSFTDGEAYNHRLMAIMRGSEKASRTEPAEFILYDLWESMRAHDKDLAEAVLEPTFTFMHAQTDRSRLSITELGRYLEYRERDVGKALLSALMRFSMNLRLSARELEGMIPIERACSRQISVVNDIFSWDKELLASQSSQAEGSSLCTAVKVVADETGLEAEAAKRVLWVLTREWEAVYDRLARDIEHTKPSEAVQLYLQGLKYQMSGNEEWSRTTLRYHDLQ